MAYIILRDYTKMDMNLVNLIGEYCGESKEEYKKRYDKVIRHLDEYFEYTSETILNFRSEINHKTSQLISLENHDVYYDRYDDSDDDGEYEENKTFRDNEISKLYDEINFMNNNINGKTKEVLREYKNITMIDNHMCASYIGIGNIACKYLTSLHPINYVLDQIIENF